MSNVRSVSRRAVIALGAFLLTGSAVLAQVTVSLPTATFGAGSVQSIPITVGDLTGRGVISFQTTVTYDKSVMTITGVATTGTLSAALTTPVANADVANGKITIACAGTSPLSGSGTLIYLTATMVQKGTSALSFASFQFNEGTPTSTPVDGNVTVANRAQFEVDQISAAGGNVAMTLFGHASVMLEQANKTIYVDPVSRYADFTQMPKADIILITHEHGDHLDSAAIATLRTESTRILLTKVCAPFVPGGEVIGNGETRVVNGIRIEAVAAYNIVNKQPNGKPFHAKGVGNGYVVTIAGTRIYFAGDTENIPEMSSLGAIDYAFLPMNLPYTMTPEMAAEAVGRIKPKVLYPYHFGNTDTAKILKFLSNKAGVEMRLRKMK